MIEPQSPYKTAKEAAEYLRATERAIMQAARSGDLRYAKIGKKFVFSVTDLNEYMERIPVEALLLTPAEVCAILHINRRTLYRWCHAQPPKLSFIHLGRNCIRFRRQLIEYFVEVREYLGVRNFRPPRTPTLF